MHPLDLRRFKDTSADRRLGSSSLLVVVSLLGMCGFLLSAYVGRLSYIQVSADPDGLTLLAILRSTIQAWTQHGEVPLWNPYFGGGIPWQGYMYNPGLSLIMPVYLIFGEVVGVKVVVGLMLVAGVWGHYAMLRSWFDLDPTPSALGAMCLCAAPWYAARIEDGNYDELALILTPLACALFGRLLNAHWSGLLLPLVYATGFAQAKYAPGIMCVATGVLALTSANRFGVSRVKATLLWAASFTVGVVLALPKLLPLLQLLELDRIDQSQYAGGFFYGSFPELMRALTTHGTDRQIVGMPPLLLLLLPVAIAYSPRKSLAPGIMLVLTAIICLGPNTILPVWPVLQNLPPLNMMNDVPKYWNILLLVSTATLVPIGLHSWTSASSPRALARTAARRGLIVLCFAALIPAVIQTRSVFRGHFNVPAPSPSPEEFAHVAHAGNVGRLDRYRFGDPNQYYLLLRNLGTVTWYGNLVLPENAVPDRYVNPDFTFTANPNAVPPVRPVTASTEWTFNTIEIQTTTDHAGLVQLNFNYDERWIGPFPTLERDGRLAWEIPPSTHARFVFRDRRFELGLGLAVIGLLSWLWLGFRWINLRRSTATLPST